MALETTVNLTDKTILAKQTDDRMAANPYTEGHFVRVEDTGQNSAFGPIVEKHPQAWRYTIRIEDVALIVDRQKYALRVIVAAALTEAGSEADPDDVVDAIFAAGITFDHARTEAWENLETKRRDGESLAITLSVAEGRQRLIEAGFL